MAKHTPTPWTYETTEERNAFAAEIGADDVTDGIYFGLPESEYHAIPRLSNSGIKWLRTSTLDFYMRSWMNPGYEAEDSKAMLNGRAYHKRILEGRTAFYDTYDAELDLADYPGALASHLDLKAACKDLGLKVSGTKAELSDRLLEADPNLLIWEKIMAEHAATGRTLLPAATVAEIELAAKMVELHPELSKCFSGGYPEVTILWHQGDAPMKARIDYLKPQAIIDYKTFGNAYGKPVDRAIATAMASERYHIQAAVYTEAVEQAKKHIAAGQVYQCVEGAGALQWVDPFLDRLGQSEQTFVFVFQQTGLAPVARGKIFPRGLVYDCGRIAMEEAIETFRRCMEHYGPEAPWVDTADIGSFDDAEFPAWMVEV